MRLTRVTAVIGRYGVGKSSLLDAFGVAAKLPQTGR